MASIESKTRCDDCNLNFVDNLALKVHLETYHGQSFEEENRNEVANQQELFHCEECNTYFTLKALLTRHNNKVHEEKNFLCEKCGKLFAQLKSMKDHDNSVHVNEKSQVCEICDIEFFKPFDLKKHMKKCALDLSLTQYYPLNYIDDHRDGGNWAGGAGVPPNLEGDLCLAMLNTSCENELLVSLETNMLHFTALTVDSDSLDSDPQNLENAGLEPVLGSDLPSPPKTELKSVKKIPSQM